MSLREIIYLDRDRVDSYGSQLEGGLTLQTSVQDSDGAKISGRLKASLKFIEAEVGGEGTEGVTLTRVRAPAHAALAQLEQLLEENDLIADPTVETVVPGQIVKIKGDATFESWSLLASLADSTQGIATLAAKIYSAWQGESDVKTLRDQLNELERMIRKRNVGPSALSSAKDAASSSIKGRHTALSVVEGRYIEDVKDVVKLFFQDQNHVRLSIPGGRTFIGLLRKEGLIGGTMEELVFNYGMRPQGSFGALFYVAELGRELSIDAADIASRIKKLQGQAFSLGLVQEGIHEVGGGLLELSEELRRPIGEKAVFAIPIAIYREIKKSPRDRPA